jgi:hypothetical protein
MSLDMYIPTCLPLPPSSPPSSSLSTSSEPWPQVNDDRLCGLSLNTLCLHLPAYVYTSLPACHPTPIVWLHAFIDAYTTVTLGTPTQTWNICNVISSCSYGVVQELAQGCAAAETVVHNGSCSCQAYALKALRMARGRECVRGRGEGEYIGGDLFLKRWRPGLQE